MREIFAGEWQGLPDESMKDVCWLSNASLSIADYDTVHHRITVQTLGEYCYLGELATSLPKNV